MIRKSLYPVWTGIVLLSCMFLLGQSGPWSVECSDGDGDGYGAQASLSCKFPQQDCDDGNADVNPGASEVCDNGVDDDCDGLADGADPGCELDHTVIADHEAAAAFDAIPASAILQARNAFRIFYGHTSHGSQVVTGLDMLQATHGMPVMEEEPDMDLGTQYDYPNPAWESETRSRLDQPGNNFNLVMWSWCYGVTNNTEEGINAYLNTMSQLEADYPGVTFVYMTGRTDGTGPTGNVNIRNNQIRSYCEQNNKVLFDFADIESWDPDGRYYPDAIDTCTWCTTWCQTHTCPACSSCSHSHCFNCYLKGKAFWWMLARLAGWG